MNPLPFTLPFLTSPYPWVFLAAIFLGAAASRATTRIKGKPDQERGRHRKWLWVCVYFTVAILLGLLAVFLPGPDKIKDMRLLYVAAAVVVLSFCAIRFKKALGIPIVLLAIATVLVLGLFLQSIRAFAGETEIAVVRVISIENERMRLQLVPTGEQPVILSMEGEYFAPIVKVVIFDDILVFLGSATWYRFEGLTSFRQVKEGSTFVFRQGNTDYYFPQPPGITESLWRLFEANETRIPGVRAVQVEMDLKRAEAGTRAEEAQEFNSYRIMIQNDGGVEIQPLRR